MTSRKISTQDLSTVTLADMVSEICERTSLSIADAKSAIKQHLTNIKLAVALGNGAAINGTGTLVMKYKEPRPGRNPKTGEAHRISGRYVVTFAAKKGNTPRIGKTKFIRMLQSRINITKANATEVVEVFNEAVAWVENGYSRIELRGFGNFEPHLYPERMVRNPATGVKAMCKETIKTKFKASKLFLEQIN